MNFDMKHIEGPLPDQVNIELCSSHQKMQINKMV